MDNLGYITHIENALNLDVDFGITELELHDLEGISSDVYTYQQDGDIETGTTYRCRLKDIAIRKDNNRNMYKLRCRIQRIALSEFKNAVDRCGRFVKYKIYGSDVYRRALVKLYDPISGRCLNDIFLNPKYSSVFNEYVR
jgi:hypothetical protein